MAFCGRKSFMFKNRRGEWLFVREPTQKVVKDALDIRPGKHRRNSTGFLSSDFLTLRKQRLQLNSRIKPMPNN
jgi:hypothetical protein